MDQERTISRAKPEGAREYALTGDAHFRTTLNTALRILAWRSTSVPAPAGILSDALRHIEHIPVEEYERLSSLFDLSRKARRGAVRARAEDVPVAASIAGRLWRSTGRGAPSARNVVVVALYAYALHVMADSQLALIRRVTAYLERAFKDPERKRMALAEAGLSPTEAARAMRVANDPYPLALEAGRLFVELTRLIEGVGAHSHQVVHAATVAPTDDEFFEIVDREEAAERAIA